MKKIIRNLELVCGLASSLVCAQVAEYGQCGGTGYTGSTTCVSPYVCQYSNDFYSQCVAGTASATTTKTTTTTKASSTTTTKTTTKTTTTTKAAATTTAAAGSRAIPSGAITVGKNGQGKYSTIAAALADTSSSSIYIYAGNYTEALVITRAVKIYGATSDVLSYSSNTVTISHQATAQAAGGDEQSATIRVQVEGVSFYSVSVINTYGGPSSHTQAIALSVEKGQFGCYACQLTGYQDTFLAETGNIFVGRSLISGAVDFIFGQNGNLWITKSTIQTLGSGCITASGRASADSLYYVIDQSTITGTGTVYLGRPWADYARVIFQNSVLPSTIQPAGWEEWSTATPNTGHVYFGEYNNSGGGAWNSARASFATKMTSGLSITTVLGSTSWIDSAYM